MLSLNKDDEWMNIPNGMLRRLCGRDWKSLSQIQFNGLKMAVFYFGP